MEQETSGYRRFKEKYGLKTDAAAGQTGGGWSRFKQKYGHEPKVYAVVISDGARRL